MQNVVGLLLASAQGKPAKKSGQDSEDFHGDDYAINRTARAR